MSDKVLWGGGRGLEMNPFKLMTQSLPFSLKSSGKSAMKYQKTVIVKEVYA